MNMIVRRVFVEKKKEYAVEAKSLFDDIRENLGIASLEDLRIINRYDVSGITDEEYEKAKNTIFSEPTVDRVYDERITIDKGERVFAIEYLPGQYDQRADSAAQCIQILNQQERPLIKTAKLIALRGEIPEVEISKIKSYCINPLESRESAMGKPETLESPQIVPENVKTIQNFISMNQTGLQQLMEDMALAMSLEDLVFCQAYFRDTEKRNPTVSEIRVIDTYWSDHCRHTTFLTKIERVEIEDGKYSEPIKKAYDSYIECRNYVYAQGHHGEQQKDLCLMDIATIGMKELRKKGLLEDLEESDEINACSITVNVEVDGNEEEWLLMFKNETHNHPTEIEPFGGAATCLGGAIRDPLSGRSYVYGAMRVTGSADPRTRIDETLTGKLPQRKITTGAATGYSSYGNQIGLATGQVAEIYHEDFVAKRMEIGAVLGAAPRKNIRREKPEVGDIVIILGGRTGRDGCGGATGSSKEHTEESISTCGAEVQKGNPPTERKIQRLFRNPHVSKMIKKCNDFGAGGVAVAIGELAEGLHIDLNKVPKKYEGLDGTELAISESQERMAVVVASFDADAFIEYAAEENLEAVVVAEVTGDRRLKMNWRDNTIVDISRDFLDTNGVKQHTEAYIAKPAENPDCFEAHANKAKAASGNIKAAWLENLSDLNVCSQEGLTSRFDSTIGRGTVLMPLGGYYQDTPAEGLVMKLPVNHGSTTTGSIMTYGYNPHICKWSPFHGAMYSVVEAVTKAVALGADYKKVRLTLQEYFEKLGKDSAKWGKPLGGLLGALYAQQKLGIPAIGGKDSMSGTFKDINVPPTVVAFAAATVNVEKVVSQEFKKIGSNIVLLPAVIDEYGMPDFCKLAVNFDKLHESIDSGKVLAATAVKYGGIAACISKMCFGNRIGAVIDNLDEADLFRSDYGSVLVEIDSSINVEKLFGDTGYRVIGTTSEKSEINVNGVAIELEEACRAWKKPLEKVFPTECKVYDEKPEKVYFNIRNTNKPALGIAKPKVLIPVFPGTNCEYDTEAAFLRAGAMVETVVVRNLKPADIEESINRLVKTIAGSQIIALPGGFSAGDEPEGSGKFIATIFRNPRIKEAVMEMINNRDGLMLGICNGFQALVKLGLLPYGEIRDITEDCPTLTFNAIGRHMAGVVRTRVASTLSPWLSSVEVGDIHTIAVSHGEGRFIADQNMLDTMKANGQIATQYVDLAGAPTYETKFNPNGSIYAIEGITSPDGRIFGKMGHSERMDDNVCINVPGDKDQKLFESGVKYFR